MAGGAILRAGGTIYHADTCRSLRVAAARGEVRLTALARGSYPGRHLSPHVLPEVRSVGFWNAAHHQSWGLNWHRNEGVELTYLARGTLNFAVDQNTHMLHKGDVTICRPWQPHRVGAPHITASRLYWLILDVGVRRPEQAWRWPDWLVCTPADRQELTRLLSENNRSVWPAAPEIETYFQRLGEVVEQASGPHLATRLALHVNELLVAVLEMLQRRQAAPVRASGEAQRRVELFLHELPARLQEDWPLRAMAGHCRLGRSQFARYCQELTNMTPRQYLQTCRITAAQRMLRGHPERPITQVALDCGFSSSQYFAAVFHQRVGQSPRTWRRAASNDPSTLK